ncbi:hypothetical protein MASR2M78_07280 [Treponema sp.]
MQERYASEGETALAVIDELALKGILVRDGQQPNQGFDGLIHAVSSLEYTIEDQVRQTLGGLMKKATRSENPEEYELRIRKARNASNAGLIAHGIVFIGVNALLMSLNAAFSPSFPWALIPFGGWGIGLMDHLVSSLRKQERLAEYGRLPIQSEQGLSLFKRLQKTKDSYWLHFSSTISTSIFLLMLNGITMRPGPSFFPWAGIPVFFMSLALLKRTLRYVREKRELSKALQQEMDTPFSSPRSAEPALNEYGSYTDLVSQAAAMRHAIKEQVEKKGKDKSDAVNALVDKDLLPTLDSYLDQVRFLAKRTHEIDTLMELIPLTALKKDKELLQEKLLLQSGLALRKEYEKSIAEIEQQEHSFTELNEQRELLELRIKSSVNTLKQMRIDITRLSSLESNSETGVAQLVKEKTAELNRYLTDLRTAYSEIDTFAIK